MTPLTPSHAATIAAIHSTAFSADGLRGWSEKECAEMLAREEYFGWLINDTAFLLLRRIDKKEVEIISLATHPKRQRIGLAKQLLTYALGELSDTTLHLETRENNTAAIALYDALGFSLTGTRPSYYKDGKGGRVDAVVMRYIAGA